MSRMLRVSTEVISGIYEIVNIKNGNKYVGSSKDIYGRWVRHKRSLNIGKHHNHHLQNAWDLYGEDCFEFHILERDLDGRKERFDREQFWYDFYKNSGCILYNESDIVICPDFTTTIEDIKENKRKTSYEQFLKICDLLQNTDMSFSKISNMTGMCTSHIYNIYARNYYEDFTQGMQFIKRNPVIGTRAVAKLSESQVKEIIHDMLFGVYTVDLARKYGVSNTTIDDIKHHRTWCDLTTGIKFPCNKKRGDIRKPILQYDLDGNFVAEYKSAREAEEITGIGHKMISRVCRGDRTYTHGFIFKFKEN